jgi:hypothetical protein
MALRRLFPGRNKSIEVNVPEDIPEPTTASPFTRSISMMPQTLMSKVASSFESSHSSYRRKGEAYRQMMDNFVPYRATTIKSRFDEFKDLTKWGWTQSLIKQSESQYEEVKGCKELVGNHSGMVAKWTHTKRSLPDGVPEDVTYRVLYEWRRLECPY